MTKRRKAVLILITTLILMGGGILYVLLNPGAWSRYLVEYTNENLLEPNDWSLSLVEIGGKLTSDITLNSVYLRSGDGSVVIFCEDALMNLNLSKILSGSWGIDALAFENAIVTVRSNDEESIKNLTFVGDLVENYFSISTLRMSSATLNVIDQSHEPFQEALYTVDLAGAVTSVDEALQLELWDLHISELSSGEKVRLETGTVSIGPTFVEGEGLNIHWGDDRFVLSGKMDISPKKQIEAELLINNLQTSRFERTDWTNFLLRIVLILK